MGNRKRVKNVEIRFFSRFFREKNLLPIHTEALEIRRNVLGDGHPDMANSYNTCGAYVSMGNYDKAIEYFEKAFRILKPLLGEYHPHTKIVLEKLVCTYQAKGEHAEFERVMAELAEIERQCSGQDGD